VEYITYNMGNRDMPDIYAQAWGQGHIYQANPSCPCYNYCMYICAGSVTTCNYVQFFFYFIDCKPTCKVSEWLCVYCTIYICLLWATKRILYIVGAIILLYMQYTHIHIHVQGYVGLL